MFSYKFVIIACTLSGDWYEYFTEYIRQTFFNTVMSSPNCPPSIFGFEVNLSSCSSASFLVDHFVAAYG
jgi:hypothetical protein